MGERSEAGRYVHDEDDGEKRHPIGQIDWIFESNVKFLNKE